MRRAGEQTVLSANDIKDLIVETDENELNLAVDGNVTRISANSDADFSSRSTRRRVNIKSRHFESTSDEMTRNRQPHFSETDDADLSYHAALLRLFAESTPKPKMQFNGKGL